MIVARILIAVALVLAASCTQAPGSSTREATSGRPSILLLSIDTLRADHLGVYGYARPTTPNLDRFAKDAVLFEHAFTIGGATLPTHTSLLTSLPYHTHNVHPTSGKKLDAERSTVAELLGAAGYRTAAFVGGGFVQAKWGLDQGFEVFDQGKVSLGKILPGAFAWLDANREHDLFLFLHTLDVHSDKNKLPYEAPGEFRDRFVSPDYSGSFDGCRKDRCASELLGWFDQAAGSGEIDAKTFFTAEETQYMVDLYDGGVAYADVEFGRLVEKLRRLGLYDRSLIIVTADHGEEFLEHGRLLHHQNYEEVAHVPLLVKLPGNAHAGEKVDGLVSMLDLMPTILAAAGVALPPEARGVSLLPMIEKDAPGREYIFIAGASEKIRTAEWSLVIGPKGPRELYDLRKDPVEKVNVIAEHPDVVARLDEYHRSVLEADEKLGRDLLGGREQADVQLNERTKKGLRALGYLQ